MDGYIAYLNNAIKKFTDNNYTFKNIFLPAIAAGAFIALGACGSQFTMYYTNNKFLSALIFSIGLVMVVFSNSELFTGNCLLIIPTLRKDIPVAKLIEHGIIVYFGNMIGAFLIASTIGSAVPINDTIINTAQAKISLSFGRALILGILCNILVCMAVYMAAGADNTISKIILLMLPIMLFVICGFEHSVANMYFIPAAADWSLLIGNLVPVTIGNIIGGCGLGLYFWIIFDLK